MSNSNKPANGSSDVSKTWLIPEGYPSVPSNWEIITGELQVEGASLFSVRFKNKNQNIRRGLLVVHGFGEHSGRYQHFPHFLNNDFSDILTFDLRGHGRTKGIRGHVESFTSFDKDIVTVIDTYKKLLKDEGIDDIHLFGHSFGGHLVLKTCLAHDSLGLKTVSVSAPFLGISAPVPFFKKAAAIMLSSVWGSLQLPTAIDPQGVSHDLRVVEAYQNDQLVHDKMTPRFFTELQASFREVLASESVFNYPLLMMIPLQDLLVDAQKSLDLFKTINCKDKFLKTYPELYHEIFNETSKAEVFEDFKSWVRLHS